jgi:hypothetical protein
MRRYFLNDRLALFFGFTALIFGVLAIAGGVRGYSAVPFWDMWDGYLGFYVKVSDGDWSAWWAQHNEHRILLARLLFWLDISWFNGAGWFLLLINYLLLAAACYVFWNAWREQAQSQNTFIAFFLLAWLCSWSQNNNLTWGFQSQFILAQLLPLAAFFLLHRSTAATDRGNLYFALATLCGVLAAGSMANGVLALPLMTAFALLAHMGWRRCLSLAVFSSGMLWLYFGDYHAPANHGSLFQAFRENPSGVFHYVSLYVGGPFYYLFGQGEGAKYIAAAAGIFLIASSAAFAWRTVPHARTATLPLALLTFILYIGGTALGTAGGRLMFGVEQALASRYMTPALMVWAALIVLYAPSFASLGARFHNKLWIPFLLLVLLMLPQQLKALVNQQDMLFERKVAALALELGIKDQPQINNIFPFTDWALSLSEAPVARNLSIFGMSPIKDTKELINNEVSNAVPTLRPCQGTLDEIQPIEGDTRYLRVRGWFFDPSTNSVPEQIQIVDERGLIRGSALTGQSRHDVESAFSRSHRYSGFKGYALANTQGNKIAFVDPQTGCRIDVYMPVSLFAIRSVPPSPEAASVSINDVRSDNEWAGSDFERSIVQGMSVLGSFVHSDADTGDVVLKMKRGNKLFYRSGPTMGRQTIEISQLKQVATVLPAARDWIQLDFSNELLPESFDVKLSDNGAGWGEWSAIAVKNN